MLFFELQPSFRSVKNGTIKTGSCTQFNIFGWISFDINEEEENAYDKSKRDINGNGDNNDDDNEEEEEEEDHANYYD